MRILQKRLGASTLVLALMIGGGMTEAGSANSAPSSGRSPGDPNVAAIRYQITNIDRAVTFYTEVLDFKLEQRNGPVIAIVSRGPLMLILSGPGSSGARAMPDGRKQEPGGWNRILIYVSDLDAQIQKLKKAGAHFRNTVEVGPGGRQIQIDDPDGNPIELHEAPKPGH
jgi:predicted enzyme related to lactoylglutathione lyase